MREALRIAWSAANGICAKRLVPFLPELVPSLERHGHLVAHGRGPPLLLAVSPATADRLLRPIRQPHGLSTTRPGRLLKHQIPVRTFADWDDVRPGFLEADLVAHCGGNTAGAFLYTLTLTDVATAWTECLPLLVRSQHAVVEALDRARQLLPFPLLGLTPTTAASSSTPSCSPTAPASRSPSRAGGPPPATTSASSSRRTDRSCATSSATTASKANRPTASWPSCTGRRGCT